MGKKLILLMLVVFEFTSCFNQISWRENTESNEISKTSIKEEAEIYISNMFIWDNIKSDRNISAKQRWPDFLSDLNIVNAEGIQIKFNDFTDEEKDIFARKWYESEVEILSEAMEVSEETCRYVERENKIIEQAKLSSYRSVDTIKQNDDFIKSYFKLSKKEYKKIKTKNTGRSISTDSSILSEFDLNIASADYLEQVYKQGYVFISDINVSSGSFFGGHAALMNKTQWKNDWKYTPNQTISISAWGDVGPYWVGKKANKVQEEPLVYWAGKASGCPQYVTIVRMRRKRWVWDWLNTGYRFEDASLEDSARAVQNAENWLDRDYAYFALGSGIFSTVINPITDPIAYTVAMVAKNSEDQFYCSQLVWRAWYNVSSEFDIQPLKPCILPEDFKEGLSGGVTVGVGSYQNY